MEGEKDKDASVWECGVLRVECEVMEKILRSKILIEAPAGAGDGFAADGEV
ncbi:MAG: hypothetical protein LUG52_01470 [Clostridia bacterium]|nr:hypothetical protein [Clostridia bacterium]